MVSRLEDLCGFQMAIELANKFKFKKEILRLPDLDLIDSLFHYRNKLWLGKLEKKALNALEKLPFGLRGKIPIPVVTLCLTQSIEWVKFHKEEFGLPFDYSCSFLRSSFFTSKGILDEEKAAREILKDTELSPSLKFCIACHYCLSDVIPVLWEQLPEDKKPKIENKVLKKFFYSRGRNVMADLWSYFLLGEFEILMKKTDDSFSLYKFKKTLEYKGLHRDCSDVSFKKCFEELNETEKEEALIFTRNKLRYICDLESLGRRHKINYSYPLQSFLPIQKYLKMAIFLFYHLDERQLKVFFQPVMLHFVLFHSLNWPYHHMFMDVVSQFWEVLPKLGFCLLLHRIVSLIKNKSSSKLCDYQNILRDFWIQSSPSLKRFFFRFEGINKRHMRSVLTYEEGEGYFISDLHSDFEHFDNSYVMCELFDSPFTFEDEKIIRLIFSSATLEEKSDIVRSQGNRIGKISFEGLDLRRIDLFIECCVPKEGIKSFKKELFNDKDVNMALFLLVLNSKGKEFQEILNWAFSAEEIKEWLKNFLIYVRHECKYSLYSYKEVKCIDKSLEFALSSNEIENFKKSLALDVGSIACHFKYSLSEGNFEDINNFLEWIYSSEIEMVKFKKDFAFEMVHLLDKKFLRNDLSSLKKFTEWSALSEEEGKDFRRQIAFSEEVIDYYSNLVAQRQLNDVDAFIQQLYEVDTFIQWAEMTETEAKNFIKLVDKHNNILKVQQKRKVESSLKSNSTEPKRSRHC